MKFIVSSPAKVKNQKKAILVWDVEKGGLRHFNFGTMLGRLMEVVK